MAWLSVNKLTKRYNGTSVLNELSFSLEKGTQLGIAGATGSSKTTLLKIIAGLLQADSGTVLIEGTKVKGPDEQLLPGTPAIGYLSQHFELRNNYRVIEELEMVSILSTQEENEIYSCCQIGHLLNRKTTALSGGERQRVALARVLLKTPKLLLLDEPFSNLDAGHKRTIKRVLKSISAQMGITTILVSHDGSDLLSWAEQLFIMKNGQIVQGGAPKELYDNPVDEYAASLLGEYTKIDQSDSAPLVQFFQHSFPSSRSPYFVRPERLEVVAMCPDCLEGIVENSLFMGGHFLLEVQVGEKKILVRAEAGPIQPGDLVYLRLR